VSLVCPGAQVFTRTYACALNMQALPGQRLLDNDLLGDGVEGIPEDRGSPAPDDVLPMSQAPAPSVATIAPQHNPPSVAACAAPLQDMYARLWQSTDPSDLGGLVTLGTPAMDPDANSRRHTACCTPCSEQGQCHAHVQQGTAHVQHRFQRAVGDCTDIRVRLCQLPRPTEAAR